VIEPPVPETPAELPCHTCGYDLRVHAQDGKCPECGASVADAIKWAAVPRRPRWRDSDPRWRRRILAGVWVLVLIPLMEVLNVTGWGSRILVPAALDHGGPTQPLNESLISWAGVYQPLMFCIGVVLLFSKERGRQPAKLDWTRRWGVVCSYSIFVLTTTQFLFLLGLVLVGIGAVFQSIPLKYQPRGTRVIVDVSTGYLRHGPHAGYAAGVAAVCFSSIVILLACLPLFDALRSSGSKRYARILLAPLALFALMYLIQVANYSMFSSKTVAPDVFRFWIYFWPDLPVEKLGRSPVYSSFSGSFIIAFSGSLLIAFWVEVVKWCVVLSIAVWLSIAQFNAWRQKRVTVLKSPGQSIPYAP
jgi:hypothetical protein